MRRLLLIIFLSLPTVMGYAQKPRLYVFLPSPMRPHALQNRLAKAIPEIQITVFGRFREFERQIENATPQAILTLPPVASQFDRFQIGLQGIRSGKGAEPYVLLSVNEPFIPSSDAQAPIGAVDLLGRRNMENFLAYQLSVDKVRVRTVTKLEDLLSLLQFQDVNAIFVPQSIVKYYRERSRLNLIVNDLSNANIGLPVLAFRRSKSGDHAITIKGFRNLDDNLKKLLGVDLWQRP